MVGSTLTLVANGCGVAVALGVVLESVVWEELLLVAMVCARTGHVVFGGTKDDLGSWRWVLDAGTQNVTDFDIPIYYPLNKKKETNNMDGS